MTPYTKFIGKGIREYIEFSLSPQVLITFASQANMLSKKCHQKKKKKIENNGVEIDIAGKHKSKEVLCINFKNLRQKHHLVKKEHYMQ